MGYDGFIFVLLSALALAAAAAALGSSLSSSVKRLLIPAVLLRILGSFARYEVIYRVYAGNADAGRYYHQGLIYADALRRLDFSIFGPENWWGGVWWGTQFVNYVSGFVLAVIGPSMRGEFLVFSLLSFAGLCLFGLAFHRAYPDVATHRYLAWLWLWPSLWFWPSSLGKDSLLLLATGMVTAGYVGPRGKVQWTLLVPGLLLVMAIRPHVAGVLVIVLVAAQWLGVGTGRLTLSRLAQAAALMVMAVYVLGQALGQLGLAQADLEGIQEFVQRSTKLASVGGSQIEAPGGGLLAIPMAYVNILMRPFPWEAHNPQALIAALELVVFWTFVWLRRRRIVAVLKQCWRSDRYLRFALPLTAVYVLMIGLVFGNLGIIARQRILVLPFLFLVLEAAPREYVVRLLRARKRRQLLQRLQQRRKARQAARTGGEAVGAAG